MGAAKDILRIVPTVQAVGLLKQHTSYTPKRKAAVKQFINQGVDVMTKSALLSAESNFIEGLP